jgi:hypothetical protein
LGGHSGIDPLNAEIGRADTSLMSGPRRVLFLASSLGLFVELALIRWIPNTLHIVAFFANLVLIASFLGLGIGMARPVEAKTAAKDATVRLATLIAILSLAGLFEPTTSIGPTADYAVNEGSGRFTVPLAAALLLSFGLVTWALIPFGRLVASRFDEIDRLPAYSINIAGSLLGVVAFSVLSGLGAPPFIWFGIALLSLVVLGAGRSILVGATTVAVGLAGIHWQHTDQLQDQVFWSPYYEIRVSEMNPDLGRAGGFVVDVNNQFLLSGLDLREEADLSALDSASRSDILALRSYYNFPFSLRPPGEVLVLGAGAGNDVAAALRNGATRVIAVEIDPAVLTLASDHPEGPLANPSVFTVLNDARAFLRSSDSTYDLILFATLDAHGLLSSMSSVRLDSFIYTLQSLEQAKSRLKDDGLLVLSFGPFREDVQYRQLAMVREVFDRDPLYFEHVNGHRTIVAGATSLVTLPGLPAGWRQITNAEIAQGFATSPSSLEPATDDWPHLYIRHRAIPREYILVLAGMVLISLFLVRQSFPQPSRIQPYYMFLGAGFLLMETKAVTEFALLVGSTWVTNSFVFGVILFAILLVNLAVHRDWLRLSVPIAFGLLGLTLVAQFMFPVASWAGPPGLATMALAALYLGIPMVLASAIFATTFRRATLGTAALASNLVGSVIGGISEYTSLMLGLRALSIIALVMYAAAFWSWRLSARSRSRDLPTAKVLAIAEKG